MRRRGTMHATLEVQISLHYAIEYSTVLKERKGVGLLGTLLNSEEIRGLLQLPLNSSQVL